MCILLKPNKYHTKPHIYFLLYAMDLSQNPINIIILYYNIYYSFFPSIFVHFRSPMGFFRLFIVNFDDFFHQKASDKEEKIELLFQIIRTQRNNFNSMEIFAFFKRSNTKKNWIHRRKKMWNYTITSGYINFC